VVREDLEIAVTVSGISSPVGPLIVSLLVMRKSNEPVLARFLRSLRKGYAKHFFRQCLESALLVPLCSEASLDDLESHGVDWVQTTSIEADELDLRLSVRFFFLSFSDDIFICMFFIE